MRWCKYGVLILMCITIGLKAQGTYKSFHSKMDPKFGNVLTIYTFNIVNDSISQDSSISSVQYYNKAGYMTHNQLFTNDTLRSMYEFLFDYDTLLTYMNNYTFNQRQKIKQSSSSFHYDKKGRLIEQIDLPVDSRKYSSSSSTTEYDKKDRIKLKQHKYRNKVVMDVRYKYKQNGNKTIITTKHYKKGTLVSKTQKAYFKDKPRSSLSDFQKVNDMTYKRVYYYKKETEDTLVYKHEENKPKSDTESISNNMDEKKVRKGNKMILGVSGPVFFNSNEQLRIEYYYDKEFKLIEAYEYFNEKLHAYVKYYYTNEPSK